MCNASANICSGENGLNVCVYVCICLFAAGFIKQCLQVVKKEPLTPMQNCWLVEAGVGVGRGSGRPCHGVVLSAVARNKNMEQRESVSVALCELRQVFLGLIDVHKHLLSY